MRPLTFLLPLVVLVLTGSAGAADATLTGIDAEPVPQAAITSRSEQFLVRGRMQVGRQLIAKTDRSLVLLDPSLVAVSAERVRAVLLQELGLGDKWRGRIVIELHPPRGDRQPVLIQPVRQGVGRAYLLSLPDEIEPERFLRAVIEALLHEYASRQATDHEIELPPWLVPGLAAELAAGPLEEIVVASDQVTNRQRRQDEPVAMLRARLLANPPLSIEQLSWPGPMEPGSEAEAHYAASARVLVRELLRVPGGAATMRSMLENLGLYYNWQTAFLNAYSVHFGSLREAEQWWVLRLTSFLGRNPLEVLTPAVALQRLETVLYTPVEVRLQTNDLPHLGVASLQLILREWDWPKQEPLLIQKIVQLDALAPSLPTNCAALTSDYRQAMSVYLTDRRRAGQGVDRRGAFPVNTQVAVRNALDRLDALDRRRDQLRERLSRGGVTTNNLPSVPLLPGAAPGPGR